MHYITCINCNKSFKSYYSYKSKYIPNSFYCSIDCKHEYHSKFFKCKKCNLPLLFGKTEYCNNNGCYRLLSKLIDSNNSKLISLIPILSKEEYSWNQKQIYDKYIKKQTDGYCEECKISTQFCSIVKGYTKLCKRCINIKRMTGIKRPNISKRQKEFYNREDSPLKKFTNYGKLKTILKNRMYQLKTRDILTYPKLNNFNYSNNCYICNKKCAGISYLKTHMIKHHHITEEFFKLYYDRFIKQSNEEICSNSICSNLCKFNYKRISYYKFCSSICSGQTSGYTLSKKQSYIPQTTLKYSAPILLSLKESNPEEYHHRLEKLIKFRWYRIPDEIPTIGNLFESGLRTKNQLNYLTLIH